MGPAIHDVLSTNVDDVAADSTGRVQGQGLVLLNREDVELALVHGSLVDGVGHRGIDQFAVCMRAWRETL